jgi:hypothetical protein
MSFNALSVAKIGLGFGALAVASIGLLTPFLAAQKLSRQPYINAALKNWTGLRDLPGADYLKLGARLARRRSY